MALTPSQHSFTQVLSTTSVAGICLIIWFHPLISNNSTILTPTLCFGSLTTLVTAICAFTKNDILKNVAFPTSSWLGLIIVTLGINQPCLTFLHIFIWRSSKLCFSYAQDHVIHILNDEQDNLKLGSLLKRKTRPLPFTSSRLTTGSLALTGIPFLIEL